MAVELRIIRNEKGQSVLEFVLMLPMMLILTSMMIKINTAIQVSIVNQKYARQQTLILANNRAYYPRIGLRETSNNSNKMVVGVSAVTIKGTGNPEPTIVNVTRKGLNGSDERDTPERRSRVRIRTTVALCTQQSYLSGGPVLPLTKVSDDVYESQGRYNYQESPQFVLCKGDY